MTEIISELDSQYGENGHRELIWSNNIKEKIIQLTFQLTRTSCVEIDILCEKYSELLDELFFKENSNDELRGILLIIPLSTRDIIAGKNAGMFTVAADFGFINKDEDLKLWQADMIVNDPIELKSLII